MQKKPYGFTLIELMIVISIISILATIALPSYQDRVIRTQVEEAFHLGQVVQETIEQYYKAHNKFPRTNQEAGLPAPEKFIGNYVTHVSISDGAINITLGNRVNQHVLNKTVTIRPAIVKEASIVPIAWIYAYASVPKGMHVMGENRTDILPQHLPVNCRY